MGGNPPLPPTTLFPPTLPPLAWKPGKSAPGVSSERMRGVPPSDPMDEEDVPGRGCCCKPYGWYAEDPDDVRGRDGMRRFGDAEGGGADVKRCEQECQRRERGGASEARVK